MDKVAYVLFALCIAAVQTYATLTDCKKDFQKIGCFENSSPDFTDLLLNDRANIKWGNIEAYMTHLACICDEAVRKANEKRSEKYVGFALHNWGECFGKTQKDIDTIGLTKQSHRCTGDQTYSGCDSKHAKCVGHGYADYIYMLGTEAVKNIDGGYSSWEAWTPCTGKCGTGMRARERTCTNPLPEGEGKDCTELGKSTEAEECALPNPCPVDGEYGSWGEYSECTKPCGGGTMQRTRKCDSPAPAHGGKSCSGPSVETAACNTHQCPVDGKYGAWSSYSACTKSCGGGVQERTRDCNNPAPAHGGKPCDGPSSETRNCNTHSCPVDGGYSSWSSYGTCSKSCASGTQTRSRRCNNPSPAHGGKECSGAKTESRSCNTHQCPINGGYSGWSSYSACSKSCGGGTKTRYRSCTNPSPRHGGKDCSSLGASSDHASCNTHVCLSSEYFHRACENGNIYISCPGSSRITITYAMYGRQTKSHCRGGIDWTWSTNCKAGSSHSKVSNACEGKQSCRVYAKNNVFGDPCKFTPKYLEIKYRCKG